MASKRRPTDVEAGLITAQQKALSSDQGAPAAGSAHYVEVDEIPDETGDSITIGVIGDHVELHIGDSIGVFLDAARRDRFAKAWAEAERRAEAHDA